MQKGILNKALGYFLYFIIFKVISSAIGLLPALCICFFIFLIVKLLGIMALSEAEFIGISEGAYNSIPYIYKDDLLVHDIVSCIRAEGDIRVLVFKSRSYIYNDHHPNKLTHRCSGCDLADWNRIINVGVEDDWDKNIQSISQNIIESNGFAQFSKTHNFNENDKNDLKNIYQFNDTDD